MIDVLFRLKRATTMISLRTLLCRVSVALPHDQAPHPLASLRVAPSLTSTLPLLEAKATTTSVLPEVAFRVAKGASQGLHLLAAKERLLVALVGQRLGLVDFQEAHKEIILDSKDFHLPLDLVAQVEHQHLASLAIHLLLLKEVSLAQQ